jgi:hypothetical protein
MDEEIVREGLEIIAQEVRKSTARSAPSLKGSKHD